MYLHNCFERELQYLCPLGAREGYIECSKGGSCRGSIRILNAGHPATDDATKVRGEAALDSHGTSLERLVASLSHTIVIVL